MRWQKVGILFAASGQHPWMQTHAANPAVQVLSGSLCRIYFSTRDGQNRSHIGSGVFDLGKNPRLLQLDPTPLVSPGEPGGFDDSGTSMGCVARTDDEIRLYYVGWNLGVTVPWRNSIGMASSRDGGATFQKHSPAPLLDRHALDPFSLSYPWILQEGTRWRMWYGSNLSWGRTEREMNHVIKSAESSDGLAWQRTGQPVLPPPDSREYAQARPCVVRDAGVYRLWFAHRGERYRLGYAESTDGASWRRDDRAGALEAGSPGEWDADMVTYPCVFDCAGERYLLYNGNAYGRSGFGLARWIS